MRILLDESVPRRLGFELIGHTVQTVQKRGWAGLKNGILLTTASAEFDVFISADANLEFQQNLASLPVAVIVLVAVNNRMETLRGLVPQVLTVLGTIKRGELVRVGSL